MTTHAHLDKIRHLQYLISLFLKLLTLLVYYYQYYRNNAKPVTTALLIETFPLHFKEQNNRSPTYYKMKIFQVFLRMFDQLKKIFAIIAKIMNATKKLAILCLQLRPPNLPESRKNTGIRTI